MARPTPRPALTGRIPSLEQSDGDLASSAPPALPAARWRDFGVTWDELDDLRRVAAANGARAAQSATCRAHARRGAPGSTRAWRCGTRCCPRWINSNALSGESAPRLRAYRARR
jgi:hypothetical protein